MPGKYLINLIHCSISPDLKCSLLSLSLYTFKSFGKDMRLLMGVLVGMITLENMTKSKETYWICGYNINRNICLSLSTKMHV